MSRNQSPGSHATLDRFVAVEFAENPSSLRLMNAFLIHRRECQFEFVKSLIGAASSPSGGDARANPAQAWETRCLAALILQQQFLRLPARAEAECREFLRLLGLLGRGRTPRVSRSVLKDGFSTTEPTAFLREFRRHLGRLGRIVAPTWSRRISAGELEDFLAASRQECRLSLARYLFHPDDVAERIFSRVRLSAGEPAEFNFVFSASEARHKLAALPDYEAAVVRALQQASQTYWAGKHTSSRLNAMVEQPIGTVVLTVKPPGSHLEIEIKRAGRRLERPLSVVYDRDGNLVPQSHRLDGGSTADMLQWEAGQAAALSKIYRLVHREDPPISVTTAITFPNTIPVGDGRTEHLIDYFSDPEVFGDDFPRMRQSLRNSIASYVLERGAMLSKLQGPWGETLEFLQYAVPAQSILVGSTSFRLDRLTRYLSAGGVRAYDDGQNVQTTPDEARRFVDTLLDEMLGNYRPPDVPYETHESYLDAAFARRDNRVQADRVHAALSRQIGTFWGTLLAFRAHSSGESLVVRNVGIRSVWERGRWRVRMIFMDHDNLSLPMDGCNHFDPNDILPGTVQDQTHVMGRVLGPGILCGEVDHLRFIYRIEAETAERHRLLLHSAMARAYQKTNRRMSTSPALQRMISADYIAGSRAWDQAVAIFLKHHPTDGQFDWTDEAKAALRAKGLDDRMQERYVRAIDYYAWFLKRLAFLYNDESDLTRSGSEPEARPPAR